MVLVFQSEDRMKWNGNIIMNHDGNNVIIKQNQNDRDHYTPINSILIVFICFLFSPKCYKNQCTTFRQKYVRKVEKNVAYLLV